MKNLKLTEINISGYADPPYCAEARDARQKVEADAHARAGVALLAAAILYLDTGRKRWVRVGGDEEGYAFSRDRKGERGSTRVIVTRRYGRRFFGFYMDPRQDYHYWQVEYVYEQEAE